MTDPERWERWLALWRFVGQIERANHLADRAAEAARKKLNDKLYS